jgi:hypothetical protein
MVLCHEIGHHLGGAPKYSWFNGWASNEGQSDYFASLKCMRKVFKTQDNLDFVAEHAADINPFYTTKCHDMYKTAEEQALCVRTGMAGQGLANLFGALGKSGAPIPDTPDRNEVGQTNDRHPAAQCRLDTYIQGALCDIDHNTDLSQSDAKVGACNRSDSYATGIRPLCWYAPSATATLSQLEN